MEVSVAAQAKEFLLSIGFGLFLGAVYDVFRILRVALPSGKSTVFIEDFLFFIISAFLTFSFIFNINNGGIRFYMLFGALLGGILYYFTVGVLVMKSAKAVIKFLKVFLYGVLRIIFFPIGVLYKVFSPVFKKIGKKLEKMKVFFKNLFSFKIKKYKMLLQGILPKKKSKGADCCEKGEKSQPLHKNRAFRRAHSNLHQPHARTNGHQ